MDSEEFQTLAEQVLGRLERAVTQELAESLNETEDHHWPPTPGTEHPSLRGCAGSVRQLMASGSYSIRVPMVKPLRFVDFVDADAAPDSAVDVLVLQVQRAVAPAPYVGNPYVYEWRVALDGANRYVAGEAVRVPL